MSDGVIATNRRGQITMINSTAKRLLNIDRETATQMSILDLLDGESPYTYSELLSKTPEIHLSRRDANDEFVTLNRKKKNVNVVYSYQMLVTNCGRL